MNQELYDWLLLLGRWLHITTGATWIGTSIFFMWLDRTFVPNPESKRAGHIGDLWMVHGGGFYHVEKLQMGPTKVPDHLHWFKWESYWTWMSGFFLVVLTFYMGDGTYLLDSAISSMTYGQGVGLSLFSIFASWFFYDFLWESSLTKKKPIFGHLLTMAWLSAMSYILCHLMSGRAAYLHIGAMMGTWMAANVFMRIIPRQVKMVEAAQRGEALNPEWPKNAKNRSTHNTYLTLPVIFIMLSNHFPSTYGSPYNWIILLLISAGGAAVREYFVVRLNNPKRSKIFGLCGVGLLSALIMHSVYQSPSTDLTITASHVDSVPTPEVPALPPPADTASGEKNLPEKQQSFRPTSENTSATPVSIKGMVKVDGPIPKGRKLALPSACAKQFPGDVFSNEVIAHNGLLKNVLIRVIKGHEKLPVGETPSTAVEVDQKGCVYSPRVVGVRVNQEVVFLNSDPIFHNVRSFATQNSGFNLAMPTKGQRISRRFDKAEIFLQTKCSVHPWMSAHIAVMEHPYFSITDDKGAFEIKGLLPGNYTLELWHEYYGTQTQEIIVGSSPLNNLIYTFKK